MAKDKNEKKEKKEKRENGAGTIRERTVPSFPVTVEDRQMKDLPPLEA